MSNGLLDLSKCFPCPRCETTDGLVVRIATPKHPGMTYVIACKCGIRTAPRESLQEALDLWDEEAAIADVMMWDSCAPREIVEDFLNNPFGGEV